MSRHPLSHMLSCRASDILNLVLIYLVSSYLGLILPYLNRFFLSLILHCTLTNLFLNTCTLISVA